MNGDSVARSGDLALDRVAFALDEIVDGAAEAGIGDAVRGVGGHRQVAALDLVLALGAGLDPLQPMRDGVVDGLVVAGLEMQEAVILGAAPVAAVERVACRAG